MQAIVPVVFFLCRIWGSVRIVIHFAAPADSAAASASSSWLQTMQAIFDPSLGFFNAVIFVFMSQQDRDAFFNIIFNIKLFRYIRNTQVCAAIFGTHDCSKVGSPVNSSGRNGANAKRVRYQGEDSDLSMSEGCDGENYHRPLLGGESASSYFNESSATYNANAY
jgi:hypothetical protein